VNPEDLFSAAAKSTNQAPMPNEDPLDDQAPPELIGGEWMDQLKTKGKDEEPRQILYNVDIALRFSPEWQGVLAYDEFKQKVRIVAAPPIDTRWPKDWSDEDDTKATIWMQEKGIFVDVRTVGRATRATRYEKDRASLPARFDPGPTLDPTVPPPPCSSVPPRPRIWYYHNNALATNPTRLKNPKFFKIQIPPQISAKNSV